jgi:two-component system sensor histidine kinase DegS
MRFRFKFQSQLPAQWTVGLHSDGDDLSETDHRILNTLARQAEIALNNVLSIETLRHQLDEIQISREALAQAQRQLLRSREDERARLARDLHDSPIQTLVGLNIQLGLLLSTGESAEVEEALKEMRAEVRGLLTELRQVCTDLRPPLLDALGLGAALRTYANEWSQQENISMKFDAPENPKLSKLPGDVAVNLFRVAQETLGNIGKHARASQVDIQLRGDENALQLSIHDNGRGFERPPTLNGLPAQNHFGLVGMRERIELIGGDWSLESTPGKGTRVEVKWEAAPRRS